MLISYYHHTFCFVMSFVFSNIKVEIQQLSYLIGDVEFVHVCKDYLCKAKVSNVKSILCAAITASNPIKVAMFILRTGDDILLVTQ